MASIVEEKMFKEAIEAAEQGQRNRARDLLTRLLRTNQSNATYWIYLSSVVDQQKERIYCLETALKLDPNNHAARRGLVLMGAREPDDSIVPVKPERTRQWKIAEIGAAARMEKEPGRKRTASKPLPRMRFASLAGIGVVALVLVLFGIFGNPFSGRRGPVTFIRQTQAPLGSAGPTATFLVTGSPVVPSPTSVLAGPTPLVFLLDVPYTPTPFYVNTPHPSIGAYQSGLRAYERGGWEDAINFFEQAIQLDTAAPDLHYYLGQCYLQVEDYLKARGAFDRAIEWNANFAPAYLGRALARVGLNPNDAIADDINRAIQLDPNYGEAYLARANYRLNRSNIEGALEDTFAAEEIYPESAVLFFYRAQVYMRLEDYENALEASERAMELDLTILDNYLIHARALDATGRVDEAIPAVQTYLTFDEENADAWFLYGKALVGGEYYQAAITAFTTALQLRSTLGETFYYRGIAHFELGQYEGALADLERTVELYPDWFEARILYGRTLQAVGEKFQGYLTINASNPLARTNEERAVFHYWRAIALEIVDNPEAALEDWQALLDLPDEAVPEEWVQTARGRIAGVAPPTLTPPPTP
jgi:tetratricopeptide (TPR) repeat protein